MVIHSVPIGRDLVLKRLTPLPVCSLIRAPASTGKRTVAQFLTYQVGISSIDQKFIPASYTKDEQFIEPELTMEMVRDLVVWARVSPRSQAGKVAIVRLDYERSDGSFWRASSQCCSALLKTLEEPPSYVRFILLASGPVVPTIVSRSVGVSAGLLSTEEVAEILFRVSDLNRMDAREVAALGGGRVGPSLAARSAAVGVREAVLGVLKDVASSDADAATARAREWSSVQTELLIRAAHEKISCRFSVFNAEELSSLSIPQAMSVLKVVRRCRGARPRLVLGAVVSALL